MIKWLKREFPDFFLWLGLTGGAVIAFVVSDGTTFHQFATGLLSASVTLLVLSSLFESIWRILMAALHHTNADLAETTHSRQGGQRPKQG